MTLSDEARRELLGDLAVLTRAEPERFVSAPLVAPTREHFPDEWARNEAALSAIGERLLAYAGLQDYSLEIAIDDEAADEIGMLPTTALELAGIEKRVIHVSVTRIGRHEDAVFALAFELARAASLARSLRGQGSAYRDVHRDDDELVAPSEEERDLREASVLAVHLGWGLLAAHGAHVYRQIGHVSGGVARTQWQHLTYGALEPDEASYLLAVQLAVRAPDEDALDAILESLPAERRTEVARELQRLDRSTLIETLELPSLESWPKSPSSSAVSSAAKRPAKAPKRRTPSTRVAFRVRNDDSASSGALGFGVGVAAIAVMATAGVGLSLPIGLTALFAPTAALWWMGRSWVWYRCSECHRKVPKIGATCAHCGRTVAGEIRSRSEILDARERYERNETDADTDDDDDAS